MTYKVSLVPDGLSFVAQEGETVLEAALNNNTSLPNRCQVGACAACLCRLVSGQVTYQLEPLLTEKEKAQGWIFACQAIAQTDIEITFSE
ncbi:2Fe-2S iron-sulfur cluster-binding protein [Vibrio sp. WXL210]|uniref:2Fe-2S iron-sulfur cluster-binding protein n=1 Tax=Vibrio sp. WXL210 TaxID=3450709 RepID=UPI003EC71C26